MPGRPAPPACAVSWLPEPTTDSVSLSSVATPTATPTPTKPPARLAVIRSSLVSSREVSRTLLPATATTFVPVLAKVCSCRIVTPAVPATPTSPPLAPATTAMIDVLA